MTQHVIAEAAGISRSYYAQLVSPAGKRGQNLSVDLLNKLANALNTTPSALLGEHGMENAVTTFVNIIGLEGLKILETMDPEDVEREFEAMVGRLVTERERKKRHR